MRFDPQVAKEQRFSGRQSVSAKREIVATLPAWQKGPKGSCKSNCHQFLVGRDDPCSLESRLQPPEHSTNSRFQNEKERLKPGLRRVRMKHGVMTSG